ncbi:MAG: YdcF family protein [Rhodospirillales bacterium]|nr:YdcF family protein [Rhodospirillales bacterium]
MQHQRPDAVVVLGAAVVAPGEPGSAMRRRVAHAVGVMRECGAAHLVVSGGIVAAPPAEAHLMRDLALGRGVAATAIVIEDRSRNTFENAVYTGRIMRDRGWRRLMIVTDAFHMRRALYVFRRLGLAVEGAPVPRPPGMSARAWYGAHGRELAQWLYSAWLFRLNRHRPIVAAVWNTRAPDA